MPYALLGDDIVIADEEVAVLYETVIQSLGVKFSGVKTHRSAYFMEFAKRLIYKGQEISPFPVNGFYQSVKSPELLTNEVLSAEKKGWKTDSVALAVTRVYELLFKYRSKFRKKLGERSYISEQVMRVTWDIQHAAEALAGLCRMKNIPLRRLTDEEASNVFSQLAVVAFTNSDPTAPGFKEPLGELAVNIVCCLTGHSSSYISGDRLVDAFPVLSVYGQVTEKYQRAVNDAFKNNSNWNYLFRDYQIPKGDSFLYKRTEDSVLKSSTLGLLLLELLTNFANSPLGEPLRGSPGEPE